MGGREITDEWIERGVDRMGLDIWSESDRDFVRELVAFYWGRSLALKGCAVSLLPI